MELVIFRRRCGMPRSYLRKRASHLIADVEAQFGIRLRPGFTAARHKREEGRAHENDYSAIHAPMIPSVAT